MKNAIEEARESINALAQREIDLLTEQATNPLRPPPPNRKPDALILPATPAIM